MMMADLRVLIVALLTLALAGLQVDTRPPNQALLVAADLSASVQSSLDSEATAVRRILNQRVPEDMPAPFEALEAVRIGLNEGMEAGLAYERQTIGRLATTTACRNLVGLFLQRHGDILTPNPPAA